MDRYPDFDVERSQSLSFIMGCSIAQKAFEDPPFRNYTNIVRSLIEEADRLADNCHMPEFTNHALPHICSIVHRASAWASSDGWIDTLSPQEAGYLLLALIIHDLGMLSQDARDLPDAELISSRKGMSDLQSWVRRTHVPRLPKLTKRSLQNYRKEDSELEDHLKVIIHIAASHSAWPWQDEFDHDTVLTEKLGLTASRLRGLNAVVAVSDLLDEDSNRCDTATLIRHKHGSNTNIAHWIRHALTASVDDVFQQTVRVQFRQIPNVPEDFPVVYRVLRNHYRIVLFYQSDLKAIGAEIKNVIFVSDGRASMVKDELSDKMRIWEEIPDFKYCLIPRLLGTFEKAAKNQAELKGELRRRLDQVGMESVDLSMYQNFLSPSSPQTDEERILLQIAQENGSERSTKLDGR